MNETLHILVHELTSSWKHDLNKGDRGLISLLERNTDPVSGAGGTGGGKISGSPAPWGDQVEELLCHIDSSARHLEADLRRALDLAVIDRGGSRNNTRAAVDQLPDLTDRLERADPAHRLVRGDRHPKQGYRSGKVVREVASWHRQARVALGVIRHHELIPQSCSGIVGEGDTEQVCGQRAIRQVPGSNAFTCGACGETYTADELHEWAIAHAQPKDQPPMPENPTHPLTEGAAHAQI
jgi:hypothetical protein